MQEWEERALEQQEAEARGEARLSQLCHMLISEQRQEELKLVLTDEAYRKKMYQEFDI